MEKSECSVVKWSSRNECFEDKKKKLRLIVLNKAAKTVLNENGRKAILRALDWKKTTLQVITLFCTFLCRQCNTAKLKCGLSSPFLPKRQHKTTTLFFSSRTSIQSFRTKPPWNLPTYEKMKEFGWNKCNKVWSDSNSIFIKRRFRN